MAVCPRLRQKPCRQVLGEGKHIIGLFGLNSHICLQTGFAACVGLRTLSNSEGIRLRGGWLAEAAPPRRRKADAVVTEGELPSLSW